MINTYKSFNLSNVIQGCSRVKLPTTYLILKHGGCSVIILFHFPFHVVTNYDSEACPWLYIVLKHVATGWTLTHSLIGLSHSCSHTFRQSSGVIGHFQYKVSYLLWVRGQHMLDSSRESDTFSHFLSLAEITPLLWVLLHIGFGLFVSLESTLVLLFIRQH